MPRPPKKGSTSRLNLEFAVAIRKNMERLQDDLDLPSVTETIRVAIRVLDILATRVKEGQTLAVKYPDGTVRELSIPEIEIPLEDED